MVRVLPLLLGLIVLGSPTAAQERLQPSIIESHESGEPSNPISAPEWPRSSKPISGMALGFAIGAAIGGVAGFGYGYLIENGMSDQGSRVGPITLAATGVGALAVGMIGGALGALVTGD